MSLFCYYGDYYYPVYSILIKISINSLVFNYIFKGNPAPTLHQASREEEKMSDTPFNPFSRTRQVEGLVMEGSRRRYYRFRASGHCGGIVTADATGCNLLCAYCWNYKRNLKPEGHWQPFLARGCLR